jgi:hypothetical protein
VLAEVPEHLAKDWILLFNFATEVQINAYKLHLERGLGITKVYPADVIHDPLNNTDYPAYIEEELYAAVSELVDHG